MTSRDSLPVTRTRCRLLTFALGVALTACMSSCTTADVTPPPPVSTPPTVSASSPTLSTPSETPRPSARPTPQPLEREVLALAQKYYEVDEAIATDRKVPLSRYYEVAGGDYASGLLAAAQRQRRMGYKVTGKVAVSRHHVQEIRASSAKSPATATVRVCIDVSAVNVVDRTGKSVVEANRSDAYLEDLHLRKARYGWRVFDAEDTETPTCA